MAIKRIVMSVVLSATLIASYAHAESVPAYSPVDQESQAMDQVIETAKADLTSTYKKTRFFHGNRNGLEPHETFLIGMTEEVISDLLTVTNEDFFKMSEEDRKKRIEDFFNTRFKGTSFYDIDIERQVIEITLENYLMDGFTFDYAPEKFEYSNRVTQILAGRFIDLGEQYFDKSTNLIQGGMSVDEYKEKTQGMTLREFMNSDFSEAEDGQDDSAPESE